MKGKNVSWIEFQKQYPNVKCSSYQFYDALRLSKGMLGYHSKKRRRTEKKKYSKIITTQTLDRLEGTYTDKELALAIRIIQNINRAPGQKIKFSLYRESDMVTGDKTIKLESTI